MKQKRRAGKFLGILNSKLVIGALIFIVLSLVSVFAGNIIVNEGNLNVDNDLNSSGVLFVNSSSGRIGIGTPSLSRNLEVMSTSVANGILINFTGGNSPSFVIGNSSYLVEMALALGNDQFSTGAIAGDTVIRSLNKSIIFGVNPVGNFPAVLDIDSNGFVGIGTLSPNHGLEVNGNFLASSYIEGDAFIDSSGFSSSSYTSTLCWDGSGSSTIWACSSARRNKANEQVINSDALPLIKNLRPKLYDGMSGENSSLFTAPHIGLIAEDVYSTVLDYDETYNTNFTNRLIGFDINETTGEKIVRDIDYQFGITTLLIKGMQEQQNIIEELKSELCEKDNTYSWC